MKMPPGTGNSVRQGRQRHANGMTDDLGNGNNSTRDANDNKIHNFYHRLLLLLSDELRSMRCDLCRAKPVKARAQNCLSLLYMWAQGLDLAYLEDMVEKESRLQATVARLLAGVARMATSGLFSTSDASQYEPWITSFECHHTMGTDLATDESDAATSGSEDEVAPSHSEVILDHTTHLRLLGRLEHYVRCLMSLLPTLQHRCTEDQVPLAQDSLLSVPADKSVPDDVQPFVKQVQDKFPKIDAILGKRLGTANWHRFRRLRALAQCHHEAGLVELDTAHSAFAPVSRFQDSGLGSSVPVYLEDARSIGSQSSFRSTATAADRGVFRVPATPIEVEQGRPFTCNICLQTVVNIRSRKQWKTHVFHDLQPYICTYDDCQSSRITFPSRSLWADHDFQTHRKHEVFRCSVCTIDFRSTSDFLDHTRQKHGMAEGASEAQLSALLANARLALMPEMEKQQCPMCSVKGFHTKREFSTHVGQHMEEIALAVLPGNVDSDDEAESASDDLSALGDKGEPFRNRFVCSWQGCKATYSQGDGLLRHINDEHPAYQVLCPMPGCRRGMVQHGFNRRENLVRHLRVDPKDSDGKHSSGHGMPNVEAQRIVMELEKGTRLEESEGEHSPQMTIAAPTDLAAALDGPHLGYAEQSLITVDDPDLVAADKKPVAHLYVQLDDGRQVSFAGRYDAGADVNIMAESIALRLNCSRDRLAPSDGLLKVLSATVPVLGRTKMTFYTSLPQAFKAWFYVVADTYVHESFDVLLGRGLEKAYVSSVDSGGTQLPTSPETLPLAEAIGLSRAQANGPEDEEGAPIFGASFELIDVWHASVSKISQIRARKTWDNSENAVTAACAKALGYDVDRSKDEISIKLTWGVHGATKSYQDTFRVVSCASNYDILLGDEATERVLSAKRGPQAF